MKKRNGFTLIELLTTVIIIAVLVGTFIYVNRGSCYVCQTGELNSSSRKCEYEEKVRTNYWEYNVTIKYY